MTYWRNFKGLEPSLAGEICFQIRTCKYSYNRHKSFLLLVVLCFRCKFIIIFKQTQITGQFIVIVLDFLPPEVFLTLKLCQTSFAAGTVPRTPLGRSRCAPADPLVVWAWEHPSSFPNPFGVSSSASRISTPTEQYSGYATVFNAVHSVVSRAPTCVPGCRVELNSFRCTEAILASIPFPTPVATADSYWWQKELNPDSLWKSNSLTTEQAFTNIMVGQELNVAKTGTI